VSNTLGFQGAASESCCNLPCTVGSQVKVVACVQLVADTQVSITTGCAVPNDSGDLCPFDITYNVPITETTELRRVRVVTIDRLMNPNQLLKLNFSSALPYPSPCPARGENAATNKLLSLRIDGVDYRNLLQAVADSESGSQGCWVARCEFAGASPAVSSCCSDLDSLSLSDIPWDSVIQVGPVGYDPPEVGVLSGLVSSLQAALAAAAPAGAGSSA
jgi:hypothetical protein